MIAFFQLNTLQKALQFPELFSLHYYPSIDSTNNWLLQRARAGAPAGTVVIADEQTAGRGRHGRSWEDVPGKAVLLSLLIRQLPPVMNPLMLTYWTALQMAHAIEETTPGVFIQLKWPNDLFLKNKKLGGILIEGNFTGKEPQYFVIGIGVNVNHEWEDFSSAIRHKAISLKFVTGNKVSREKLVAAFLNRCATLLQPKTPINPNTVLREYKKRLLYLGEQITVHLGKDTVSGILTDLTPEGFLLVSTLTGDRVIHSGEIF